MITDDWLNCYPSKWTGIAIPSSMNHPAKFSSKLIARIYAHLKAESVLEAGSFVLDPFAGVGLGSLDANRLGINWYGVEIEKENVMNAAGNIYNWRERYRPAFQLWGESTIFEGDSRVLASLTMKLAKKQKFDAVISSPPFLQATGGKNKLSKDKTGTIDNNLLARHRAGNRAIGYGNTAGQIASMKPGDFYESALDIIRNCYEVLRPAGRAVWVLKNYVLHGEVIDFTGKWRELCESAGFETIHHHKAQFARNHRIQYDLFGGEQVKEETNKSFFRRVVEKKHNLPTIDFESVLCMKK